MQGRKGLLRYCTTLVDFFFLRGCNVLLNNLCTAIVSQSKMLHCPAKSLDNKIQTCLKVNPYLVI